jgi:predicted ATP-grasp superfamily ATP-dependent carboligase
LREAAEIVGFPCVVKPTKSVHWRERDNWNIVANRKAFRVSDLTELQGEYEQVANANPEVMLQEWIPGLDDELVIWGGYVRQRESPLAYFTARKLLQCPEEFGTGCVVRNESIPELLEPSLELCRALDYRGIAEIEYKWDACNKEFKLIEINPRHWDWHELGRASQVNLTWAAYCDMTARELRPSRPTGQSTKWVAEDALLMHTLSGVYHRKPELIRVWKHLRGSRIWGIFSWNDPMPLLSYALTFLAPKLVRAVIYKIRAHALGQSAGKPVKA